MAAPARHDKRTVLVCRSGASTDAGVIPGLVPGIHVTAIMRADPKLDSGNKCRDDSAGSGARAGCFVGT